MRHQMEVEVLRVGRLWVVHQGPRLRVPVLRVLVVDVRLVALLKDHEGDLWAAPLRAASPHTPPRTDVGQYVGWKENTRVIRRIIRSVLYDYTAYDTIIRIIRSVLYDVLYVAYYT